MADMATTSEHAEEPGARRDFLYLLTGATAAVGTAALVWPLIDAMNPSADVLALASTDVDLSGVEEGMRITVTWRGRPVFVDHRTQDQIEKARAVPLDELPDPQTDEERVIEPQWLITLGVCTHLGCVPLGRTRAIRTATTAAISAPATARTTIPPHAFAKGRRRATSTCPNMRSSPTPWSASAEVATGEQAR